MYRLQIVLHAVLVLLAVAPAPATTPIPARSPGVLRTRPDPLDRLPLAFEPNRGQADPAARFLARALGGLVLFTPGEVVLARTTPSAAPRDANAMRLLRVQFVGADPAVQLDPQSPLAGRVSYFVGADPANWQAGLPRYAALTYHGLYPGIDLTYTGTPRQLKGTYVVAPGADPTHIRWRYAGARSVTVDAQGALQVALPSGLQAAEAAPLAWQERAGVQQPVAARFVVDPDGAVRFALGPYDPARSLVIDPEMTYSSYLGGMGTEAIYAMTTDAAGNLYLTGYTSSPDFPLRDPIQPTPAGFFDVFITKLNPSGSDLVYSTYLGGRLWDIGAGIAVDSQGNTFVVGNTDSSDFPLANPVQPVYGGGTQDAFVAQLDPSGTRLVYSTYLGGNQDDIGGGVAVRDSGQAYVVGGTDSPNFPVVNPLQAQLAGVRDVFVTRIAPAGAAIEYSTYLGGINEDQGQDIALDADGNVYLIGLAGSGFPLVNPIQLYGGGTHDAFVAQLNPSGSALLYSTYLGGSGDEWGLDGALNSTGSVYATGTTTSFDFPTVNPLQPDFRGVVDAFVAQINPAGSALVYSTYLGGSDVDMGYGVEVDRFGRTWVSGQTVSADFPLVNPFQPVYGGGMRDAFVAEIAPGGNALLFSSYLGGSQADETYAMTLDRADNAYIGGRTFSPNFPIAGWPFQPQLNGAYDAFITKIEDPVVGFPPTPTATVTATPQPTATATLAPPTPTATPGALGRVYVPAMFHNAVQP
jgi:hypothetical protein